MKYLILFLSLISTTQGETHSPKLYLKNKISSSDKRYPTFYKALELLNERKPKVIVETGTSRCGVNNFAGDGGSTIIFSEWAMNNQAEFYSVDIEQSNLDHARSGVFKTCKRVDPTIHFICSDSIPFLRNFGKTIDFLYLDSYDFDVNNPFPSQHHHLLEISAAFPFLNANSVVLIDDCDLPHGEKGKLAIEFLLQRGWRVLENRYQVLLVMPK